MGRVRASSILFAALAVGLLLSACGGGGNGKLLPGTTADQITQNLDQVQVSHEEGNCEGAEVGVSKVSTEVDELGKVDVELKKAMRHAAAKLSEVVSTCRAQEEEEERKAEETAEEEVAEAEEEELAEEEAEEEAFDKEQKAEEREEKDKSPQEEAEEHAEQPGPSEQGEEAKGKAKGHEQQEEVEPPVEGEEEVTPPAPPGGGGAGGIGPGAAVEGGP